jgi:hypothetical protein
VIRAADGSIPVLTALANYRLAVADRSVTPAVELELDRINVSLREVRSDGKKPWPVDASVRVVLGGRLTANVVM